MKILVVCKYKANIKSHISPFVSEQVEALKKLGCETEYFQINGKGLSAYFKAVPQLKKRIKEFKPDVIHAHYGLCGLTANLQRTVPVVTTYHGSDINNKKARYFSKFAIRHSDFNIFVSQRTVDIVKPLRNKYRLLPCGINIEEFNFIDKADARKMMGLQADRKYILFASSFDNQVKDPFLAISACNMVSEATLLEMKGYSRQEVTALMYACDALLMTSRSEGSPQVIKEALACGLPLVSTDVGDVSWVTKDIDGCFVAKSRNADEIANLLVKALALEGRTQGRQRIMDYSLTNGKIARILVEEIYSKLI